MTLAKARNIAAEYGATIESNYSAYDRSTEYCAQLEDDSPNVWNFNLCHLIIVTRCEGETASEALSELVSHMNEGVAEGNDQ